MRVDLACVHAGRKLVKIDRKLVQPRRDCVQADLPNGHVDRRPCRSIVTKCGLDRERCASILETCRPTVTRCRSNVEA